MTPDLSGKNFIVTGGASGIGRAVTLALAAQGAKVIVADLDESAANETIQLAGAASKDSTSPVRFHKTNVAVADEVKSIVERTVNEFGHLDGAFNNAGIMGLASGRVAEGTEENWDKVIDINLKGTWLCVKYEIKAMRKSGGGSIVNTASAAGMSGGFASAPYIASKHGILGLTKAAALECAKQNIRVNAVCPGYIRTPMLEKLTRVGPGLEQILIDKEPMGRLGTPEEVANAVLWLLSDQASFVTGHGLVVDGGILAD